MTSEEERFFNDKQVAERYNIGRATVWKWTKEGTLPKPITIGHTTRWPLSKLIANEEGR